MNRIVLSLVIVAPLIYSQQPPPFRARRNVDSATLPQGVPVNNSQPEYIGPKGSVSGTVTDSVTGAPVKKAQVRISMAGSQPLAVTDASGMFTFDQLPPGTYTVFAQHPAYPQNAGSAQRPQQVALAAGETRKSVNISLVPGIEVSGRIVDSDGDPIGNCNVAMLTRSVNQTLQPLQTANTNAAGDYMIPNVPAGRYYLQAHCNAPYLQPRAFAPPDAVPAGPQVGYTTQYFPGTASLAGAQKLKLVPGQTARGLDFRMSLQTVTTVSIHVEGFEEDRRNRLLATLAPIDTPATGNFNGLGGMVQPRTDLVQIRNVPPGTYTLRISSSGPERAILARETVQVTEEPRELTVHAQPVTPLSGIVHREPEAMSTPSGTQPSANPASRTNRISFSQVEEQGAQISAAIAEDGSFTLPNIGPGRYHAISSGTGFVQSVELGGQLTEGPDFELKPGAAGPLIVNVGFTTGTLSGEVQIGDSHAPQILVFVTTGQGSHSLLVSATPGQPLKYSLPLPPGAYRAYALEVNDPSISSQLLTGDVLNGREEKAQVRPSAETVCNLKLITAADIEKAEP